MDFCNRYAAQFISGKNLKKVLTEFHAAPGVSSSRVVFSRALQWGAFKVTPLSDRNCGTWRFVRVRACLCDDVKLFPYSTHPRSTLIRRRYSCVGECVGKTVEMVGGVVGRLTLVKKKND